MSGVDTDGIRCGRARRTRSPAGWAEGGRGARATHAGGRADRAGRRHAARRGGARRHGATRVLGVVYLKDIVKGGMRERFDRLRAMGIRTVMITGDNPLTAAAIAAEAGVDDFLAEAKPEDKMALIRREQAGGRLVAMTGDGTNDAPGARAGGRRGGDEHRHPGGEGSRQHDRPRLEPDQAHRGGRDREAAAHDARLAHDVLDRQRRREVLRDHPGDVRGDVSRAQRAQHHAAALAEVGDPERRRSSTRSSSSRSSRWRCAASGTARRARPASCAAISSSTASAGSSSRSSASS